MITAKERSQMRKIDRLLLCAAAMLGTATIAAPAQASPDGVKVGVLTCHVSSGWGYVIGSSKRVACDFAPSHGVVDRYTGRLSKLGVDLGYTSGAEIVWDVIAPTSDVRAGDLQGSYAGATASATVVEGVGAHVLFGGFDKSIALQPVSVEGNSGVDVAAGIGALHLTAAEPRDIGALPATPSRVAFAVYFGFNRTDLSPEAHAMIAHAADVAQSIGPVRVRVVGHADTVGSDSYNDRLSLRRADVVRDELFRDGLKGVVVAADGRGFHDPMILTGPGVRERQNRGAVIEIGNVSVSDLNMR
jgi:outer membrane protein OmpA-like peptidoglycan-associated protein